MQSALVLHICHTPRPRRSAVLRRSREAEMGLCRRRPLQVLLLLPLLGCQAGWSSVQFRNSTLPSSPGWSMSTAVNITGWKGRSAVLPCTFTYLAPVYQGRILVVWYKYNDYLETIFTCSFPNSTTEEQYLVQCLAGNEQYRLVGDPRQNNISLEFKRLTLSQNGSYFCRVELTERQGAKWTTEYDTGLLVIAPATILTLQLIANDTVECVAEGNPKPNITWSSGHGGKFSESTDSRNNPTQPYSRSSKITVIRNGTFTCLAENEYGRAQEEVGDKPPPPPFPVLAVGIPVLILLLLGLLLGLSLLLWKRKGSSCKTLPNRKTSDVAIFNNEEVKETEPVTEKNPDGCTYADIVFTKKPTQATLEQVSPNNDTDVTYAVVAIQKKDKNQPL